MLYNSTIILIIIFLPSILSRQATILRMHATQASIYSIQLIVLQISYIFAIYPGIHKSWNEEKNNVQIGRNGWHVIMGFKLIGEQNICPIANFAPFSPLLSVFFSKLNIARY